MDRTRTTIQETDYHLKLLHELYQEMIFIGKYFTGLLFVAFQFKMDLFLKMVQYFNTHKQGISLWIRTIQR